MACHLLRRLHLRWLEPDVRATNAPTARSCCALPGLAFTRSNDSCFRVEAKPNRQSTDALRGRPIGSPSGFVASACKTFVQLIPQLVVALDALTNDRLPVLRKVVVWEV